MKTVEFFVIEDTEGDTYVLADWEATLIGKTHEDISETAGGHGKWLTMALKPATAKLEREIRNRCLVGNEIAGFKSDDSLYPGARFEVCVDSWWKSDAPTAASFDELPPNLADRVDLAIRKHMRPNFTDNADFLALLNASAPPS